MPISLRCSWLVLAVSVALCPAGRAQSPSPARSPDATVETVSSGLYRIGPVTIDKEARQVRFPAVVNQVEGPIEYLLVGSKGKTHESLLRTDAEPAQVHTAMLLLGVGKLTAKGGPPPAQAPPSALDAGYLASAKLPDGAPVKLLIRWQPQEGGGPVTKSGESGIDNLQTKAPMTEGNWTYNGSYFSDGHFAAQEDKSFAAIITDPAALLNNPRPGHEDESIWTAAAKRLPAVGTKIEFIIQLLPAAP